MDREVTLFDGNKTRIVCDDSDVKDVLTRIMIQPFADALNKAWLSNDTSEKHAKNYMDFVGSLMMRNLSQSNIQSKDAILTVRAHEVPAGAMDDLDEITVIDRKPKQKVYRAPADTRFSRMERLRKSFPRCKLVWARIDTTGAFSYNGNSYRVTDEAYSSKPRRGFGDYFKYDSILILDNGDLQFFDQDIRPVQSVEIIAA